MPSAEKRVHPRGRLIPLLRQDMRVDVEGGADLRVTEILLHKFGVEPLGQEQRRTGMPEVMEAHGAKPCGFKDLLEPMAEDGAVEGAGPCHSGAQALETVGASPSPLPVLRQWSAPPTDPPTQMTCGATSWTGWTLKSRLHERRNTQ